MDLATRKSLTAALSRLSGEIAEKLRTPMRAPGPVRARAEKLHAEERVGDPFEVWSDLLSRRAAVLWVLKSLYVRVLEDRGLLRPKRILDPESQAMFAHLARDLGETAYLRWVYKDLASRDGGLPELFAPQAAEIARVPDALSRKLIDFWRGRDPDTGQLGYAFDEEHFDGRFMGDLYQDLDPVVKKRYALLQTPDFIIDFILDETLTPAIEEWGVETVRVLDPACGSGHFLLAAFKRLVAGMRSKYPEKPPREVVEQVLGRVVGIDLNDYACALARARLVMTALESSGERDLGAAAPFHPQVYWADALEQVEREDVGQLDIFGGGRESKALLTRPEVRVALRPVLKARFHVVVGNPPFDTEKDPRQREYHQEKLGKTRRYEAAAAQYSLGPVFGERFFQLTARSGFVGLVMANSFVKRQFGKAFIERVLPRIELTKIVDASAVVIPGAGIRAIILIGRNRAADIEQPIRVVMSKRAEPHVPPDPATGKVWLSIVDGHARLGFENDFISVTDMPRQTLAQHPWSIEGGGATDLKAKLEGAAVARLTEVAEHIGFALIIGEDDIFIRPREGLRWKQVPRIGLIQGDDVRDWCATPDVDVLWPFDPKNLELQVFPALLNELWFHRRVLEERIVSGSTSMRTAGRVWYDLRRLSRDKLTTTLSIVFSEVSTHNNFCLDRGGNVFKQTAPIVKLPATASEAEHLTVLGQLNSSSTCFWLKQVCHSHGEGGGSRVKSGHGIIGTEAWKNHYAHDGANLSKCPLVTRVDLRVEAFSRALDTLARSRVADSPRAILDAHAASGAAALRAALISRRDRDITRLYQMVGLQEELDWLCYRLYGIDPDAEIRDPEHTPPLTPGHRPFEITLAQEDADRRAALARGEEPDEQPTAWFERHGWEPVTDLTSAATSLTPTDLALIDARLARTAASRDLALIEQPTYKRRWYRPDHTKVEREAMELWLADRIEAWAKDRKDPFTSRQAAAALRAEPAFLAVGELYSNQADFDIDALVAERIRLDSVPNNKHHVFKPEGLLTRKAWEKTWELQHLEDAGKLPLGEDGKPTPIPPPPKYDRTHYLKAETWSLRGKLDVPKERFIAFTEVPPPLGDETLYGWAGWTHRERARVLQALDERLESAGVKVPDRYGLLYGVWFLLPYVAWESADAARDFRRDVKSLVGEQGVTEEMLDEWARRFPAGKVKAAKGRRGHTEPGGGMATRRSPAGSPRPGRRAHGMLGQVMQDASVADGDAKAPGPSAGPARQRDPRGLAIVLEELLRIGPATAEAIAGAVRARAALDPGADRRAEPSQSGPLRELQHLGWIEAQGDRWALGVEGDALARGRPTEAPFAFARRLCVAGERAYQGVVSRLLARLWELSPERQGAVVLPAPAFDVPPADVELLEPWLRGVLRAQRDLVVSLAGGLDVPDAAIERAAGDGANGRWSTWDKLPAHRRKARVRDIVEDRTLEWLFGGIASPDEVKVWQTRMDWAGLSLLARRLPAVRGQVWFPVGAFRAQAGADFVAFEGVERDGRTYHCHAPSGPAAEASFAGSLFEACDAASRRERAEYVSLAEVRDAVCYDQRISHEGFQGLLQAIVPRVLRGELPYAMSLEVDITPEERARLGTSLTIVIDHIPRHIIAMRRTTQPPPSRGSP